jgi:hypothetical protein
MSFVGTHVRRVRKGLETKWRKRGGLELLQKAEGESWNTDSSFVHKVREEGERFLFIEHGT